MIVRCFAPLALLAGLLSISAMQTPAQGETLLRWKYEAGQKFRLTITQDMQMKFAMGEKTNLVNAVWTADMKWEVTAVDDNGLATLVQEIERIRLKMQGPQGVMAEYDSQSDEKPQGLAAMLATLFDAMVGKPYSAKIGPRGNVEDMTLPQGMVESMGALPNGAQLGDMLSEQGLKDMAEIVIFPENPVNPGDTWSTQTVIKNPVAGDCNVTSTMRYVGPEERDGRDMERIDLSMDFQFEEGKSAMIKITDQEGSGSIYFEDPPGQFTSESTMTMKMHVSAMGNEMVQEVQITSKAECSPLETPEKGDD